MKKYDRESKKWVEAEEITRKHAKRKFCKGGKEHDWILCLPQYVSTTDGTVLGLDKVEEYYKIEDEREDAEIAFDERLAKLGIKSRLLHSSFFGRRREYVCTVCLKRKYL